MTSSFRLASAPISWGITGPDTPGNPDPDDLLDAVAAAGYVGCELGPFTYFGSSAEAIACRMAKKGLVPVAIWHEVDFARPLGDEQRLHFSTLSQTLRDLGIDHLLVSDTITPERLAVVGRVEQFPETWWSDDDWAQAKKTLATVAAIAGEWGVKVALHPHVAGHLESEREVRRMLDVMSDLPVSICLDTGHLLIGGADPIELFAQEAGRVSHLHAKDVDQTYLRRLQQGEITYDEAVAQGIYCDLGHGMVNWTGYAKIATSSGFSGWVVAEQDCALSPGDRRPYESNERNYRFLKELLGA